ncbi:uncharacterized protein METZ01_LOCUS288728, partial [marine metagenome]
RPSSSGSSRAPRSSGGAHAQQTRRRKGRSH